MTNGAVISTEGRILLRQESLSFLELLSRYIGISSVSRGENPGTLNLAISRTRPRDSALITFFKRIFRTIEQIRQAPRPEVKWNVQ